MPCLAIHLAVAKKYLEKHNNENYDDFILGTIAPDINLDNINDYIKGVSTDKVSHHFGIEYHDGNLIQYMKNKVNLNSFFELNDINTSFLRAYFLHLLCDYFFLDKCAKKDVNNMPFNDAVKIGTNDYDLITPILIKKYDLIIPSQIEHILARKGEGEIKLLDLELVDNFINEMSNMDLYEIRKKYTDYSSKTREI